LGGSTASTGLRASRLGPNAQELQKLVSARKRVAVAEID
jgi:hypothetical protein